MRYAYPVHIERDGNGYSAWFDDLPGGTAGATREEALERAADLLVTALAILVEEARPPPAPRAVGGRPVVSVPALEAAKLALHEAMIDKRCSNVELARRMGIDEKDVRRLRDPLHRSHIARVETALRLLGRRLEVTVSDAA